MPLEDIKAMPVQEIADENAILWLWTTNAHLRVAFEVVEAWGFRVQDAAYMGEGPHGNWRMAARPDRTLLCWRYEASPSFCTRIIAPCWKHARREHSRKPEEFYALVEATCPGGKVELFCRQHRNGWHVYGNDTKRFGLATLIKDFGIQP